MSLKVIYEDNHLLVVSKPVNMPVQADASKDLDLLTQSKAYIKEAYHKPGDVYLGLVHRLDRPTGGALVFARTSKAASRLSKELRNNHFERGYLAVIHGHLENEHGTLKNYLYKDKQKNIVSVMPEQTPQAKYAQLDYQVVAETDAFSLVRVQLKTGRSHQIRVQFSHLGHPLYGDQKYGQNINQPGQQLALWDNHLAFHHPTLKKRMAFNTNPPATYPWTLFFND